MIRRGNLQALTKCCLQSQRQSVHTPRPLLVRCLWRTLTAQGLLNSLLELLPPPQTLPLVNLVVLGKSPSRLLILCSLE